MRQQRAQARERGEDVDDDNDDDDEEVEEEVIDNDIEWEKLESEDMLTDSCSPLQDSLTSMDDALGPLPLHQETGMSPGAVGMSHPAVAPHGLAQAPRKIIAL